MQKFLSPKILAKAIAVGLIIIAATALLSVQIHKYIGKFVILSHSDSYTTLYGHCSQVLATAGRTVKKGQIIAMVGHTGRTTGPHLHFEIRKNGLSRDPLRYLW